jgi:PleD family two-component response regulator
VALLAKLEDPSPEKMLQLAEDALQRAKREGRNRVLLAD